MMGTEQFTLGRLGEIERVLMQLANQPNVTINLQNSRNTYPDAKAQRAAIKNGENRMARVGDG